LQLCGGLYGTRSRCRLAQPREHHKVGVEPDALDAADTEERESVVVLPSVRIRARRMSGGGRGCATRRFRAGYEVRSTRKGGGFYGYKLHLAVCTRSGLPLAWQIATARRHESLYVAPLIAAMHARGFAVETCAMDKGYDNARVYAECEARECDPVIPLAARRRSSQSCPSASAGASSRASCVTATASAISTAAAQRSSARSGT
jgi:hypothetical protein